MLKQRVWSAVILAPLALAAILWLPATGFAWMVAGIFTLGTWEWARLAGFDAPRPRLMATVGMLLLMAAVWLWLRQQQWLHQLNVATSLLWLMLPLWFLRPGKAGTREFKRQLLKLALGCWIILGGFEAIVWLRELGGEERMLQGSRWIFMLLFLIWAADIGAYFTGRALGRNKLAPAISPGKTWEGVAGGLLFALLVGYAGGRLLVPVPDERVTVWLLLVAAVSLVSVVGDLMISLLKRQVNMKDSSRLIPGHGGILDRFDSLLAASPWLAMGVKWLQ